MRFGFLVSFKRKIFLETVNYLMTKELADLQTKFCTVMKETITTKRNYEVLITGIYIFYPHHCPSIIIVVLYETL